MSGRPGRLQGAARMVRTQGLGRLLEEKELRPGSRARVAWERRRWRREHPVEPGSAVPFWVLGLQRSGTNLLVRCLAASPEVEVCSENDRRAFSRYRVRSDAHLASVLSGSRCPVVVFKPLCDSHRIGSWLDGLRPPGRAVWMVRAWEARTRSALARFGDAGRQALCEIVAGRGEAIWQAQGMSVQSRLLLGYLRVGRLSPASGAALLWYVRNSLYFELGLDRRPDVRLLHYEDLLAAPATTMQEVTGFVGMGYRPAMVATIESRPSPMPRPLDVDPRVAALCDDLTRRLRSVGAGWPVAEWA